MKNHTLCSLLYLLCAVSLAVSAANAQTEMSKEIDRLGSQPLITGQGTKGYITLWDTTTKIGNSFLYQINTQIGLHTLTPTATLDVNGTVNAATSFNLGGTPFAFGSYANTNAFLGFAGNSTMTGTYNTALGSHVLFYNTTGSYNTVSGAFALGGNSTGSNNTASGFEALSQNLTGGNNTALGYLAGPDQNSPNLNYATAIGAGAVVSESNALVLGGPLGTYASVNVGIGTPTPSNVFTIAQGAGVAISDGWTTYSSRRWKTNIQLLQNALSKVEQLRGVSYDLKDSGKHEIGVIAEEVGKVVPEVVSYEENGKDARGVDYSRLTALLIEATKEQQQEIQELRSELRTTRQTLQKVQAQMAATQPALVAAR
jgi:hypothetical protein